MNEWMNIPSIQEWQLHKLLRDLYHPTTYKFFPGLLVQGFVFQLEGIDQVNFMSGRPVTVKRSMSALDIQFFRDTLFTRRHKVLQIPFQTSTLMVGFWADNQDQLEQWIQEQLPDVDTSYHSERPFIRQV